MYRFKRDLLYITRLKGLGNYWIGVNSKWKIKFNEKHKDPHCMKILRSWIDLQSILLIKFRVLQCLYSIPWHNRYIISKSSHLNLPSTVPTILFGHFSKINFFLFLCRCNDLRIYRKWMKRVYYVDYVCMTNMFIKHDNAQLLMTSLTSYLATGTKTGKYHFWY